MELFIFGSFWFWTLVAVEILLLFMFVEYENGIGATISVVGFGVLLQWFGNVDIIDYVRAHPLFIVSATVVYFALGAVWGVIKWWLFCHDALEEYEERRAKFFEINGLPRDTKVVPPEFRTKWRDSHYYVELPQVKHHKIQIIRWMSFWVISMIWSFINDFVKRIFRTIYQRMATYLQGIADRMFSTVKDDFDIPPK